ncbi:MAG TPA: TIGR03790 family protein, partial [Deltaproteobacteria bacterium]|nr:TIGR03790 family protein [Deltaproteobacteria bacterium]
VDAFEWVPGAVGYHIASGECVSLKDPKSRAWCPMMLKDGIAGTLGPVGEPYIRAFPLPEIFFGLLTSGRYTLVETYFMSLPYLSWKMVLIGDPLYRPFLRRSAGPVSE